MLYGSGEDRLADLRACVSHRIPMDPDPERRPGMACRRPHRYAQGVRRPASLTIANNGQPFSDCGGGLLCGRASP